MHWILNNDNYMVILQLILFLTFREGFSVRKNTTTSQFHDYRRQRAPQLAEEDAARFSSPKSNLGIGPGQADQAAVRFTTASKKSPKKKTRSTPFQVSLERYCDHLAYSCLYSHRTGQLCAKTHYWRYQTFENYCIMDYVNCMEGYELFQVSHMGGCFVISEIKEYANYMYHDDFFLDQYYVVNDN